MLKVWYMGQFGTNLLLPRVGGGRERSGWTVDNNPPAFNWSFVPSAESGMQKICSKSSQINACTSSALTSNDPYLSSISKHMECIYFGVVILCLSPKCWFSENNACWMRMRYFQFAPMYSGLCQSLHSGFCLLPVGTDRPTPAGLKWAGDCKRGAP